MKIDAFQFWKRVDELWEKSLLTKQEFCKKTNGEINFFTWSNKKSQGKLPSLELAQSFATALGVSLEYLISGTELADPISEYLKEHKDIGQLCYRLTLCDAEQLHCVNALLDTWRIGRSTGGALTKMGGVRA